MFSEYRLKQLTHHKMALDQPALLDLLGELKLRHVTDRIRVATEALYQELIDAESDRFHRRRPISSALETAPPTATAPSARSAPRPGTVQPEDPEAARRVVLPGAAGVPPAGRPGVVCGRN